MNFLITLLLTVTSLGLFAQKQIGFNASYGMSYYNIKEGGPYTNVKIDYKAKPAMEFELNFKKRWPGIINFGTSLSYQRHNIEVSKKYTDEDFVIDQLVDYKLNMLYLKAFPEFVYGEKIRYYFQIGPSLSYMFSSVASGYIDKTNKSISPITTINSMIGGNAQNIFNTFSFGFFTGIGIDFPVGDNITLSLSSQFDYSINSWFKKDHDIYSSRVLYFRIGANYIIREVK